MPSKQYAPQNTFLQRMKGIAYCVCKDGDILKGYGVLVDEQTRKVCLKVDIVRHALHPPSVINFTI